MILQCAYIFVSTTFYTLKYKKVYAYLVWSIVPCLLVSLHDKIQTQYMFTKACTFLLPICKYHQHNRLAVIFNWKLKMSNNKWPNSLCSENWLEINSVKSDAQKVNYACAFSQSESGNWIVWMNNKKSYQLKYWEPKNEKSKVNCEADQNNVYCSFITLFRLAIPVFFFQVYRCCWIYDRNYNII